MFANALKAIDHAAFFGFGHTQHFDGISLNISGDRLYQLEQYEAAIREYEKGLVLAPKDINLMNSLGVCYGVTGDVEKAKACFESALKISPKEIMVLYNLGLTSQVLEDTDKAVLYLRKAHGIDGRIFEVELLLGHLLFQKRNRTRPCPTWKPRPGKTPDPAWRSGSWGKYFSNRMPRTRREPLSIQRSNSTPWTLPLCPVMHWP